MQGFTIIYGIPVFLRPYYKPFVMFQKIMVKLIGVKFPVQSADTPSSEITGKVFQTAQIFISFTDKAFLCGRKKLFIDRERHLPGFRQHCRFNGKIPLRNLPGAPITDFGKGFQLPADGFCDVGVVDDNRASGGQISAVGILSLWKFLWKNWLNPF